MGHRALLAYRREADDDSTAGTDSEENPEALGPEDESDSGDGEIDREDGFPDPEDDFPDANARYDLHRSHWGGANFALLGHLSAEEPFAADAHFAVDPEPVATDLAIGDIVANYLDFLHHEAFYRVGTDYETTAYHVLWFGLEADCEAVERSETVGHGALVEAHPDDADYLRGWFRGTKAVVGEMVDRETITSETAAELLAERAETWAADREVMLPD